MENKENNNKLQRTEEIREIIDRMPQRTGRHIAIGMIIFVAIMLFMGFKIKYPESVSGSATIKAQQSPVRLTAPSTGRLHLLINNNEQVESGEMIAYIESSTNINSLFYIDSMMSYTSNELIHLGIAQNSHLSLGELTSSYLKLLNSIEKFNLYLSDNSFVPRIEQIKVKDEGNMLLLKHLKNQSDLLQSRKEIQSIQLLKDSIQYFQLKAINEGIYLQSKSLFLNAIQSLSSINKEIDQILNLSKEFNEQLKQLIIEQKEYEQNLTMNLLVSYDELSSNIDQWKQKYAFVAPYPGKVEMLNFWKDNAFLKMGEETFAILPVKNPVMAQVIIPAYGAGKVIIGQHVILKLEDFPYLEFGSINGTVKSISMLSSTSEGLAAQQKIQTYQVNVELPDQLKTNYGAMLNFKHDIKGTAQILVKRRKLIERLFDNLKYMANE